MGDTVLTPQAPPSTRLLSGNAAIAQGAWEAGVRVGAGYPGTPSTEILENLARLRGVDCEWSPNEKVALEVAVGAALAGGRAIATMKHVGLNVAADPFFSGAYMGVNAGLVVVSADDPGMHSSQNEQDNRLFARAARVPLLEPATPEEARRFTAAAFALSEAYDTPVLLRTTTRLSHGKGEVTVGERAEIAVRPYRKDPRKNVVLPAHGRVRHQWIEERRMPALSREAERWVEVHEGTGDLSFITAGPVFLYVREAFPDAAVLKLGMSYPLPAEAIRAFAAHHPRIMVVEELEPFLEEQVRALGVVVEPRQRPRYGELSVDLLRRVVPGGSPVIEEGDARASLPARPPVLCPGCSHRGPFYALRELDAIVTGDIGCYTLGALPPLSAMDSCMNMGASIGMAHGMEKVLPEEERQRLVAVIGDSTFHHSGVPGLVDVVYNGGASTVMVLDNRTTAMTGHQDHPGTGHTLMDRSAPQVDIAALARSLGVRDVHHVDPYDLPQTRRTIEEALQRDEASLLLVEAPCVLNERVTFGDPVSIDLERCTDCHACTILGCPAIEQYDDHLEVNALLCNGCTMCQQVCADCNAGIDVSRMLDLVEAGRHREAVELVLQANPLPAVAGRVCPHPCDHSVNALGWPQEDRYAEQHPRLVAAFPDGSDPNRISIRDVERFLGDWALEHVDAAELRPAVERDERVAVVGSGPAGLSAAWYLRREGYRVTVMEVDEAPGGMLRHGIPAFRLPRHVLDGEIRRLQEIGVEFWCDLHIGRDLTFDDLEQSFAAVVVAVGDSAPRNLTLEGASTVQAGFTSGLDFLRAYNAGQPPRVGRRVAVVGGGNTAVDCARAAHRLGAEVTIYYRRTEAEMPAIRDEVAEARAEGVHLEFQVLPTRLIAGLDGRLRGIELQRVTAGPRDDSGRRRPVPVPDSEFSQKADTLLSAIGEHADLDFLNPAVVDRNGRVAVRFTGATTREGIFACGDAAFGQGTVTQAIATGRRVADAVADYLNRQHTIAARRSELAVQEALPAATFTTRDASDAGEAVAAALQS